MDVSVVINQMMQLFILMGIGFTLYRVKLFDNDFISKLNILLLNVTLPALIISSISNVSGSASNGEGSLITIIISALIIFATLPIFGFLIVKFLPIKKEQFNVYWFMSIFSNIGFMGFPIMDSLFGSIGVFYTSIFTTIFNVLVFTLGIYIMDYSSEKFDFKAILSPATIVSFLVIILYFLKISLPSVLTNTLTSLGSITTPIAMLLIGASLAKVSIKHIFSDLNVYLFTVVKQVLLPILYFPLLNLLISDDLVKSVSFIVLCMPVGNFALLFANKYNNNSELAAKVIFITTLATGITIPGLIMIFLR